MNVLLVPAHPGFPGQIPQSRKTVVVVVLFTELNISNRHSDVHTVATFMHIYGLGQKPNKPPIFENLPDARTEAQKEDMSRETQTYGNLKFVITSTRNLSYC